MKGQAWHDGLRSCHGAVPDLSAPIGGSREFRGWSCGVSGKPATDNSLGTDGFLIQSSIHLVRRDERGDASRASRAPSSQTSRKASYSHDRKDGNGRKTVTGHSACRSVSETRGAFLECEIWLWVGALSHTASLKTAEIHPKQPIPHPELGIPRRPSSGHGP